jgi:hypothetical protein
MLFLIVTLLISEAPTLTPPTPVFDGSTSVTLPVIRREVHCGWVPVIEDEDLKKIIEKNSGKKIPDRKWVCH